MPTSTVDSGESEISKVDSERDLEEVTIILKTINNLPKKLRPSNTQVVIGIVHRENIKLLSRAIRQEPTGFFNAWKTKIMTSSFGGLEQTIRKSKCSGHHRSLILLVTPLASEIEFQIPATFKTFTIIRCANTKYRDGLLSIYPESTFCNIRIPDWDLRTNSLRHHLRLGPGVCLENRFSSRFARSCVGGEREVEVVRNQVEKFKGKNLSRLQRNAILAAILGVLVGGATAIKIYDCIKITASGLFLTCKAFKWDDQASKVAEIACGESYSSAEAFTAVATTTGPPLLLGASAGAAVGALVYYLSWDSLFGWLGDAADGVWSWLVERLKTVRNGVASPVKKVEKKKSRMSPVSRRHSFTMSLR